MPEQAADLLGLAAGEGLTNPAEEEGGSAAQLNERIQQIVTDVQDIITDAQATGVYSDRESLAALKGLMNLATDIHERWMEGPEMEGPMDEEFKYNPAKVIEETKGKDQGPFSGPMLPNNPLENPNAYGGRVIEMESPNYGLPKKTKK